MAVRREVWSVMAVRREVSDGCKKRGMVSDGCKKRGMVSDHCNKGGLVSTVGFTLFVFFLSFLLSFFLSIACLCEWSECGIVAFAAIKRLVLGKRFVLLYGCDTDDE